MPCAIPQLRASWIASAFALVLLACGPGARDARDANTELPAWARPEVGELQSALEGARLLEQTAPPPALDPEAIVLEQEAVTQRADERKRQTFARYLEAPFPSPESEDPATRCWGYAGFALAAYRSGHQVELADRYLREIDLELGVTADGAADASPCYFALPLLARIHFDPAAAPQLTEEIREILLRLMHRYVSTRSRVDTAEASSWHIAMSENHDAIQKGLFLLASRALKEAPAPYGPGLEFADGRSVAEHHAAWVAFWLRYFADRAREGVGCEIASPIYAKHTLASYLGVRDFSGDAALTRRSEDFLQLYWSDVAQDFLPGVGIRAGARTRVYKDAYLKLGTRQSTREASYLYGWHDEAPGSIHPLTLAMAASDFVPLALIRAQATRKHTGYMYRSRRCGRGQVTRIDDEPHYRMQFDGGRGSHLVRTSYLTDAYALGALTFHPNEPYNALVGQNRSMGVQFTSHPNDRISIHGIGRDREGTVGYDEITGVAAEDVLVIARDPENRRSAGIRIFVSAGTLWDSRETVGPWWFSRTEAAYLAIRIPDGGFEVVEEQHGYMLEPRDSWTPIVVQLGQPEADGSFELFQHTVLDDRYVRWNEERTITKSSLSSDDYERLASSVYYRSLRGDVLAVWSHNARVPRINGVAVDLLPDLTYDSPYLASRYRSDLVSLYHPDFGLRELDFGSDAP